MDPIPIYDATAPIACSIGTDEIDGRIELIQQMRANLHTIERTSTGCCCTSLTPLTSRR